MRNYAFRDWYSVSMTPREFAAAEAARVCRLGGTAFLIVVIGVPSCLSIAVVAEILRILM